MSGDEPLERLEHRRAIRRSNTVKTQKICICVLMLAALLAVSACPPALAEGGSM
jgi:hypothetical protein